MIIQLSLLLTLIFFIVFGLICTYWSRMAHKEKQITLLAGFSVSLIYSFLFFVGCFIFLSFIKYLMDLKLWILPH